MVAGHVVKLEQTVKKRRLKETYMVVNDCECGGGGLTGGRRLWRVYGQLTSNFD